MAIEKSFNEAQGIEIFSRRPDEAPPMVWDSSRRKELPDEELERAMEGRLREGEKLFVNHGNPVIVTESGIRRGAEKYGRISSDLESILKKAAQTTAKIFPFGSLVTGTYVEGTVETGFYLDPDTLEPIPKKSDIDVGILIEGEISPGLRELIARKSSPAPEFDYLWDGIRQREVEVWVIEQRERGYFRHYLG